MTELVLVYIAVGALGAALLYRLYGRLRLSRAKHPSVGGHARLARRLARQVPYYSYDEDTAFACDGAAPDVVDRRRRGFKLLSRELRRGSPCSLAATRELEPMVSDLQFTNANRVPFQFRDLVRKHLPSAAIVEDSDGIRVRDIDGNWSIDVGGSYGVNLLGYDFYKKVIKRAVSIAGDLGPVLGPYHPLVAQNAAMIREFSGLDEVSFHMSGTEAVMQAVRLARFNTGRTKLVLFCGAYHGWWDGVQAGIGHGRSVDDIYLLKDMSHETLRVLETRSDIACVLVNPLQCLHPNAGASSDAMLIDSARAGNRDDMKYRDWLQQLRAVCDDRGIALIVDEVFVGFRLGLGGAQEYFGIRADMVTYGKTIGGGLPVGVVAGTSALMRRYRDERPTDLCFARGTFNSHPYVMASMNEFLRHVTKPGWAKKARKQNDVWDQRAASLNEQLRAASIPVVVKNLSSVWMLTYTRPSRFNWLMQYYLRAQRLSLSWVGTGRLIFSHNFTNDDFKTVAKRIVAAGENMAADGWWDCPDGMTDKSIRRKILKEMLRARFAPGPAATKT